MEMVHDTSMMDYSPNAFDDMPVTEAKAKATEIREKVFNLFNNSERSYYEGGGWLVMLEETGLARSAMVEIGERPGVTLEQGYNLWYDDENAALELPSDFKSKAKATFRVGNILYDAKLLSAPEKVIAAQAIKLAPILNRTEEKNGKVVLVGSPAKLVKVFKASVAQATAEQRKVTADIIMQNRRKVGLADPIGSKSSYATVGGISTQVENLVANVPKVREENLHEFDLTLLDTLQKASDTFRTEVIEAKKVEKDKVEKDKVDAPKGKSDLHKSVERVKANVA